MLDHDLPEDLRIRLSGVRPSAGLQKVRDRCIHGFGHLLGSPIFKGVIWST